MVDTDQQGSDNHAISECSADNGALTRDLQHPDRGGGHVIFWHSGLFSCERWTGVQAPRFPLVTALTRRYMNSSPS